MNPNANQNGSAVVEVNNPVVKRGPGRPVNPNATKIIFLNMNDKTLRSKGRPKPGTQYIKATIRRSETYTVGQTQLLSEEVVTTTKTQVSDVLVENRPIVAVASPEPVNQAEVSGDIVSPNGTKITV